MLQPWKHIPSFCLANKTPEWPQGSAGSAAPRSIGGFLHGCFEGRLPWGSPHVSRMEEDEQSWKSQEAWKDSQQLYSQHSRTEAELAPPLASAGIEQAFISPTKTRYSAPRTALQHAGSALAWKRDDNRVKALLCAWTLSVSDSCSSVWPNLLGTGSSEKTVSIYQLLEQFHFLIISKLQASRKGQMNSSDNILTDNVLTFLRHS